MKHLNIKIMMIWMISILTIGVLFPCLVFAQERLCVNSDIANMRSGPGTNYDVLWQVEKFHPFIVIEKKGNWVKIKDFENDTAWIHESLLSNTPSVITKKDNCNVRSGPSTDSSKLFTAEKGVPFKMIEQKGNWIKIMHVDGDIGWIYKTLVW